MMVFNLFTTANDYNFGAQMTERPSRFLADKQKAFVQLLWKISSKGVTNYFRF